VNLQAIARIGDRHHPGAISGDAEQQPPNPQRRRREQCSHGQAGTQTRQDHASSLVRHLHHEQAPSHTETK